MTDVLTTYEREQLAAVEAGEMPLAVYADWLEENGDERAVGARWLAEHDKWPRRVCAGWWWTSLEIDARGLPPSIRSTMPRPAEPYGTFAEALLPAMEFAAQRLLEADVDELGELLDVATRGHHGYRPLARWLAYQEADGRRGAKWLVDNHRVAEVDPPGGGTFWQRAHRNDVPYLPRNVLPRAVFDRLRDGFRSGHLGGLASYFGTRLRRYVGHETAFFDAARAVEEALDAGEIGGVPQGR